MHGLLSSQLVVLPAAQVPAVQTSPDVHALPSSHARELMACPHPLATLHESLVQGLLSSQFRAGPGLHAPPPQVSPDVHASPSLHAVVNKLYAQPVAVLQVSPVHGLLSSQLMAVPAAQSPDVHVSPEVHAFPSSHAAVLATCWQSLAGSQASSVQGLPSSQPLSVPA